MARPRRAMELRAYERENLVAELQRLHRIFVRHMTELDPRCAHYEAIQTLNFQLRDALKIIDPAAPFGIQNHSAVCHPDRPPQT